MMLSLSCSNAVAPKTLRQMLSAQSRVQIFSESALAKKGAEAVQNAFKNYQERFGLHTVQTDDFRRKPNEPHIDYFRTITSDLNRILLDLLGPHYHDKQFWDKMGFEMIQLNKDEDDYGLALTYFYQVRRMAFLSRRDPDIIPAEQLIVESAKLLEIAHHRSIEEFLKLSETAKDRFEQRNWPEVVQNAKRRYHLFLKYVTYVAEGLKRSYGDRILDESLWNQIKEKYQNLVEELYGIDLAFTFFYAVRREVFKGESSKFRFVDEAYLVKRKATAPEKVFRSFSKKKNEATQELLKRILQNYPFEVPYRHVELFTYLAAEKIEEYLVEATGSPYFQSVQMLKPVFYRNKGVYLVGRIQSGDVNNIPLIIHIENRSDQLEISGIVMKRDEVRNIFGYSVSSFFVDTPWHREVIDFLISLFGKMERAAMYKAIGYHHHARSVLYKEMSEYIESTDDQFEKAPGVLGNVMTVFTLPGFRYVFKIINDKDFINSKSMKRGVTRKKIKDRYRFINETDRVGRLLEAIDFEKLRFKKALFSPELLELLKKRCSESIIETEDELVFTDIYLQRKTIPLDIYLREQPAIKARKALIDYGNLLRDMAKAGIFIADFMLKNFGVTSTGKVVSYDFDDVESLLNFDFTPLPLNYLEPDESLIDDYGYDPYLFEGMEESYATEAFYNKEGRVFPDQTHFFGIPFEHKPAWDAVHGELRTVRYWGDVQKQIREGFVVRFYPFPDSRLLIHPRERDSFSKALTTTELTPPTRRVPRRVLLNRLQDIESSI